MSAFSLFVIIHWIILLCSSSHLLNVEADKCLGVKCGNITIPYPFRLAGSNCGLPGFDIICKRKSSLGIARQAPFLPTLSGDVQIINISDDHLLVHSPNLFAFTCNKTRKRTTFQIPLGSPFRVSEFNKFFSVGCNTYGEFHVYVDNVDYYWDGCVSLCGDNDNRTSSRSLLPCKEKGCCQVPIPSGYSNYTLSAAFYNMNATRNCSYSVSAIVDQHSWEMISKSNTTHFQSEYYFMRLDWAILNDTCNSAQSKGSYECAQNTDCEDREWGYVCKCKSGYHGDGYHNGTRCKEIHDKCIYVSNSIPLCFQTLSIITGVSVTLTAVLLGGGCTIWTLKRRKSMVAKLRNFDRNGGIQLQKLISSRGVNGTRLFASDEIEKATNKFSQSMVLGSGGYGIVYKACLGDGTHVAIKKSREVDSNEIEQFINEVVILSQINHRNVVRLLGCCLETPVPLLVYEYVSNGTLFDHLHGNKYEQRQLVWEDRLLIATETAEALSYLHSAASVPIVHRDVKSSNILLDDEYNPKVADFGVSRLVPMGRTHVTTVVQGTLGYLDPEYFQTVHLTEKSDVYSFGVVLVELLTGLKPVSYERMKNQSNLAVFFLSTVKTSGLIEIIDPRLDAEEPKNIESMRRIANLAKECLSVEGEKRPTMKEVVQELLWIRAGTRPHTCLHQHVDVDRQKEEMVDVVIDDNDGRFDGVQRSGKMVDPLSGSSDTPTVERFRRSVSSCK